MECRQLSSFEHEILVFHPHFPLHGRTSPLKGNNRLRASHRLVSANRVTIYPLFFAKPR
jgi:hypothetical protein